MKRRILAILLSLCLLVGLLPTVALAEGDNSVPQDSETWEECNACSLENPHMIYTTADLDKIRTHTHTENGTTTITGYFKLANDIVFRDEDFQEDGAFYNNGWGWTPIGHNNVSSYFSGAKFCGDFDGNNYAVKNLYINRPNSYWYNGLFAGPGGSAHIYDLILEGFDLHADNSGSLCGQIYGTDVVVENITAKNCKITGILTAAKPSALLIGCGSGTIRNIKIMDCSYDRGNSSWYGGAIVSEMGSGTLENVTVTNCYLRPYAYMGLMCSTVAADAKIKNISITDCQIEPTHGAWNYLVYNDYRPTATDQTPSITDIVIDVEVTGVTDALIRDGKTKIIPQRTIAENDPIYLDNIDIRVAYDSSDNVHINIQENSIYVLDQRATGIKGEVTANVDELIADLNEGTVNPQGKFVQGTLTQPIRDGYVFDGWYTDSNCTGDAVINPQAGTYYYAKWIDLGLTDISLQYQGTQNVPIAPDGVTFSNWKSEDPDIATVADGTITAVNVGETTITATATSAAGGTATVSIPVKVTPMPITFGNGQNENPGGTITYQYTGEQAPDFSRFATFYPAIIGDQTVTPNTNSGAITLTEGTDIVFNYDAGDGANDYSYLPVNVTAESNTETGLSVTVKLLNENYRFVTNNSLTPSETITLSVAVTHENLTESTIQGLGQGTLSFTYDGTGKAAVTGLTGISADNISEFTLHFHPWGNTEFAEQHLSGAANTLTDAAVANIAPKEPGTYLMIISGKSNDHYTYKSWIFTIAKATVTVKAVDKSAYVGDAMPELTYTVSGLASGDSLSETVSLSCEATDTNTAGTYTITPSGGAVPNTEHYNSEIVYQSGTLTVSTRSSGGGGGSSSGGSSVSGDYIVAVDRVTGGKATVSPSRADKGDTVTITVKPDTGYELDKLVVTDKNGGTVKVTDKGNGKFTFTMPGSKVEITATFVEITEEQVNPFSDVTTNDYYYDAVLWAVENGVTNGSSATTFSPNVAVSRAQMVTFLWRAHGSPKATGTNPFTDVSTSDYYYDAVLWAAANGVTTGTSATTFSPDMDVTRAQAVTFQWRAAGSDTVSGSSFGDVATDAWYVNAVTWAVANGITNGTGGNNFSPDAAVSRAQAVTFLWRELA